MESLLNVGSEQCGAYHSSAKHNGCQVGDLVCVELVRLEDAVKEGTVDAERAHHCPEGEAHPEELLVREQAPYSGEIVRAFHGGTQAESHQRYLGIVGGLSLKNSKIRVVGIRHRKN